MPNPPICETLHLDQRKLPAEVFERISKRAGRYKEREERARQAWENFGKPGRDPQTVGNIFNVIATQGSWTPHLKIAQMQNHWDQVVGDEKRAPLLPRRPARRHSDDPMRQPRMDHHHDVHDSAADRHHSQETRGPDHQRSARHRPPATGIQPRANDQKDPILAKYHAILV